MALADCWLSRTRLQLSMQAETLPASAAMSRWHLTMTWSIVPATSLSFSSSSWSSCWGELALVSWWRAARIEETWPCRARRLSAVIINGSVIIKDAQGRAGPHVGPADPGERAGSVLLDPQRRRLDLLLNRFLLRGRAPARLVHEEPAEGLQGELPESGRTHAAAQGEQSVRGPEAAAPPAEVGG